MSNQTPTYELLIEHNGLQNLDGGTPGEYYHLTAAQHAAVIAGIGIPTYSQTTEPVLGTDGGACFWIDTDDSNRVWFVYRRGLGDQVKVELT